MAEKEERPYFENSISQLEELFEQLKADPNSLRALDFELSFRTTNRAAKLRSKVAAILLPFRSNRTQQLSPTETLRLRIIRPQLSRSLKNEAAEPI